MPGYPQFATLLGKFPELLMFRKFDELSAKLLLYQQAEIVNLEQRLKWCEQDIESDGSTADLTQNWEKMTSTMDVGKVTQQRELLQELQQKLQTYHETILRLAQVQTLPRPTSQNRQFVSDWLITPEGGNDFLKAFEPTPWWPVYKSDLVALAPSPNGFDEWLARHLTPVAHFFGRKREADTSPELGIGPVWEYKHRSFALLGTVFTVFWSSALPITSILVLFYMPDSPRRLAMIAVLTVMFSAIVGFVARCSRAELFAVTAAFAAVQVVFIQGLDGNSN